MRSERSALRYLLSYRYSLRARRASVEIADTPPLIHTFSHASEGETPLNALKPQPRRETPSDFGNRVAGFGARPRVNLLERLQQSERAREFESKTRSDGKRPTAQDGVAQ
jgi:hypothetical protein